MLENYAGLIVVAAVDEVPFIFVARLTVIGRHLGMTRADCALIEHIAVVAAAQVMQIEAVSRVSDFRIDDRVVVARKDIDALVRDIARVVDIAAARPLVGFLEEWLKGGGRSFHAGTGRSQRGTEIAQQTIGGRALRTIIRPTGDDSDAFDNGRPGNSELHGHESAGRYARDRTFLYVCIVGTQWWCSALSQCRRSRERSDNQRQSDQTSRRSNLVHWIGPSAVQVSAQKTCGA